MTVVNLRARNEANCEAVAKKLDDWESLMTEVSSDLFSAAFLYRRGRSALGRRMIMQAVEKNKKVLHAIAMADQGKRSRK